MAHRDLTSADAAYPMPRWACRHERWASISLRWHRCLRCGMWSKNRVVLNLDDLERTRRGQERLLRDG